MWSSSIASTRAWSFRGNVGDDANATGQGKLEQRPITWDHVIGLLTRIALHLDYLIVDNDELYGDGVNVAARTEAETPAGDIVITRNVTERLNISACQLGA
jgi:class 3 adenylate cyclase